MKKLFIFLFAICLAQIANAQFRIEAGGAYGGFGNNNIFLFKTISLNTSRNIASGMGFDVNVSYNIKLDGNEKNVGLSIAPGVGYFMNNVSIKGESGTLRTQWIQVPLCVVYDAPVGYSSCTLVSSVGLYYGYALKGTYIDPTGTNNGFDFINAPVGERLLRRNDFGFCAKLGLLITKNIGFYLGYNRGFLDISDSRGYVARLNSFRFGVMLSL